MAGKRAITADTDLRLCRFFGLSNGYWLRAQVAYDTEVATALDTAHDRRRGLHPGGDLGLAETDLLAAPGHVAPCGMEVSLWTVDDRLGKTKNLKKADGYMVYQRTVADVGTAHAKS